MLKITKTVSQSVVHMSGCGRSDDYNCGINAKHG